MGKQIDLLKDLVRAMECVEAVTKVENLERQLKHNVGSSKYLSVSDSFSESYGIDKDSLLSSVLENYHQLRLQDDKD